MNKIISHAVVAVACACCAYGTFADDAVESAKAKNNREVMLRHTGGQIRRPDALPGEMIFINAQQTVASDKLASAVEFFGKTLRIPVKQANIEEKPTVETASTILASQKAAAAVILTDDDSLAMPMLVAPEMKWAIVNVAWLKKGARSEAFTVARTEKEMVRAALIVCGAAASQYNESLMKAVTMPKHLDDLVNANPPMDVVGRTKEYLNGIGISSNPYTTYLNACRQGWAPAPTNEYQKAVWDKVHAEQNEKPTNPIKIRPGMKPAR